MLTISMSAGSNLSFSDEETEARETKRCGHGHRAIPSVDCTLEKWKVTHLSWTWLK